MTTVTLFTKPGCGLCEEAEDVIETVRSELAFDLIKRNILDDLRDYNQYRHEIPVILVDGREIARHRITRQQLQSAITSLRDVTVVVMAKFPEPGRVKTRLMPELSAAQSAAVHEALICHLIRRLDAMGWGGLVVCHDPPDCVEPMRELIGPAARARYAPQCQGDLGARLSAAAGLIAPAAARIGRPPSSVMFLGVDSPDVPAAALHRVAEMLISHEVVIGPADDGGYWSVALQPHVDADRLFAAIEWSSGRECNQTIARARALGYKVGLADRWDDVDHPGDLRRLLERLRDSADPQDRALLDRLKFLPLLS
jgi:rSAM/selenodomain-associated transferase 1